MRLSELSDIHSGYTVRGRLVPQADGGTPALQLRDVSASGDIPAADLQRYDLGELPDRYFVTGGEVVFRSRGEPNTAVAIPDALPEPIAVIVPLVVIRPHRARILPEYLAWAINQPIAQRALAVDAQGTSVRMIPMRALERLDIPVPDLHAQRRIVTLSALAAREMQLLQDLAERRTQYMSAILHHAARTAEHKDIAR